MRCEIPEGWREWQLGDLVEIFDGPHATPRKTIDGPIFLGIECLNNGRLDLSHVEHLSEEDFVRWTRRVTPKAGDVVFAYETRLGEAAQIVDGLHCCLGRRMGLLRAKTDDVFPRYLLYAYLGPQFQSVIRARTIHGSTVDRIPLKAMGTFPIVLPLLAEQRRILSVIGALDDKIDSNRRLDRILLITAEQIYEYRTREADSTTQLGEVATVIDCLHSKKPERVDSGKPLLQLDHIRDDGLVDLDNPFLISDSDYELWTRRMEAVAGDIVITNVGRIGVPAQLPFGARAALGRNMTGIRVRPNWPYPCTLILALMSSPMRRAIELLTDHGTIMGSLNVRNIPKLPLPKLAANDLADLEAAVSPLWQKREVLLRETRTLRDLRDALLPRLVSGEMRIPDAATEEVVTQASEESVVAAS